MSMSTFRRNAREMVLQALYCELYTGCSIETIESQFWERNLASTDIEYFVDIFRGTVKHKSRIDEHIKPYVDRELDQTNPVELSILRMGTYELAERTDVPFQVIINEAIELSKMFGGSNSYRFINGILDNIASDIRPDKVKLYKAEHWK